MTTSPPRWQFWIDRGGTFTDIVGRQPDGVLVTLKLLSDNPEQYRDSAVAGIRRLLGLRDDEPVTPERVECVKMGTTVATNALLERKGEPTLLVTTRGFRDALRIAYQDRPRLFERHIVLPELLYAKVLEADERMAVDGSVVRALDEAALRTGLQAAFDAGLRSAAVVFMHGWRHTAHEVAAARLAREIGFAQVSVSHETSPLMKFVSRGDTTVVDAYLSPILRRYVDQVGAEMPGVRLLFMQSSGGLADAHAFQGKDAILSGPAGGIVGMVRTAQMGLADPRAANQPLRIVGFDMGGTSTDVSHFAGEFERAFETQVAGVRMRAPMMSIHTVAAGGGSVLSFDGARMRAGPHSAGANPGPASYRRGGPLTVTDANVMLGKIQPEHFPSVFGPGGDQPLDRAVVADLFAVMADDIARQTGTRRTPEDVAEGFIDIAVGAMANAIKKISVARGYDVTRYTLQCFGGAGGQHACRVADALGMGRVFAHPLAGVLSAYGMGLADQTVMRESAIEAPLASAGAAVAGTLARLAADAQTELERQGAMASRIVVYRRVHLRYQGTDSALVVPFGSIAEMTASFEAVYRQRFSFLMHGRALMAESVSVEAVGAGDAPTEQPSATLVDAPIPAAARVRLYSGGAWHEAALVLRGDTRCGQWIDGPAIVAERNATTVVEPGWRARITAHDHLLLERVLPRDSRRAIGTDVDPVMLEVFNNLFMNIAEQMGLQLQNTAYSVNIKERLDFSCALFDAEGNLIANAPHMPVHLGSMSESIKTVIERNRGEMRPGDVYVLNDPYHGGTHLPDVTVVTPVFDTSSAAPRILFFVGSRGHHADIGGTTPGSMPPFSTRIEEEGVQIDNVKLVEAGRLRDTEMLELLASGEYPSRNPQQNLADLKAQIAANERGVQELRRMVEQFGLDVVHAYMRHVQDNAEESVRRVITKLRDGAFTLPLDNGAQISVVITVDAQGAQRRHRLQRQLGAARQQLQRAARGVHGGGAVCVPHAGGRRHSAQRRLPEAAARHHSRRLNAQPEPAGLGGGWQRRDLHLHHQRAVRRTRGDGGRPVHDEQLHLRQRAPAVLRDRLGRQRCGRGLRRHERGADPHDQLAAHRPRGARVPLPGAPRELRHPPWLGWCGALARRRRRRAPRALSRADDRLHSSPTAATTAPSAWPAARLAHRASTAWSVPTGASSRWTTSPRSRWRRATSSSSRPPAAAATARRAEAAAGRRRSIERACTQNRVMRRVQPAPADMDDPQHDEHRRTPLTHF